MKKIISFMLILSITVLSFTSLAYASGYDVSPLHDLPPKEDTGK